MREAETSRFLPNLSATRQLGQELGQQAQAGDILLLRGDLGAGKTSLTQGIAQGLGISDPVTSPTFALLHEYHEGRLPLYHFDLYRLEEADIVAQGFSEYWEQGDGLTVLEWAERLGSHTPSDCLELLLEYRDEGRLAIMRAHGDRSTVWLEKMADER